MKLSKLPVLLAALMVSLAGCSSAPLSDSRQPVALAIVMADGGVPTRAQVAHVHAALQSYLTDRGFVLTPHPRAAERLLHVKFIPDPLVESGGRVEILSGGSNVDRAAQ